MVLVAEEGDEAGGGVLAAKRPPRRAAVPQLVEGFVAGPVEGDQVLEAFLAQIGVGAVVQVPAF